jgi:homoserine dehydrogenase
MRGDSMNNSLRIGIAGLGTVGGGALKILLGQPQLLAARAGRSLQVLAVSARDKKKYERLVAGIGADTHPLTPPPSPQGRGSIKWVDNPLELASDPDIDVVVECIGGSEGAAKALVEAALKNKKSVVTANKALIAHHGVALAQLAEASGALLAFEAAVAGGIPIIKGLRDGLAANRFTRIAGILNGTCNYILTTMWNEKRDFDDVLAEAQAKGFAEADPSFDIDGVDAAHKLAILGSLAYGIAPAIDRVSVEGIRRVTLADMQFADELGYTIKLLGIASEENGGILMRVHPCMVAKGSQLAAVSGAFNAVLVEGDSVGNVLFEGRGAGEGPTASSVVADIMDIARGANYKPFTLPADKLTAGRFADMSAFGSSYYLRLNVIDQPGVLADVTAIFKKEGISMRSVIQHSHSPGEMVPVVITTHVTQEAAMARAQAAIAKLPCMKEAPFRMRIE